MNYRTTCVNNAVDSIQDAIAAIQGDHPSSAIIFLRGALKSLRNGLDIGPSDAAIAEICKAKDEEAA